MVKLGVIFPQHVGDQANLPPPHTPPHPTPQRAVEVVKDMSNSQRGCMHVCLMCVTTPMRSAFV